MVLDLAELVKTHSEEISRLAGLHQTPLPVLTNLKDKKPFSLVDMVKPHSDAFYVQREASVNLFLALEDKPAFTLIHGPRRPACSMRSLGALTPTASSTPELTPFPLPSRLRMLYGSNLPKYFLTLNPQRPPRFARLL